jgi:hypothetical protein
VVTHRREPQFALAPFRTVPVDQPNLGHIAGALARLTKSTL